MALFKITAKQNSHSNGLRLEKGMSVQVDSRYSSNPIVRNGGQEAQDAFMRIYGLDLKKLGVEEFMRICLRLLKFKACILSLLFLYDLRNPTDCLYFSHLDLNLEIYLQEWQVVHSYPEFVNWIETNGLLDFI